MDWDHLRYFLAVARHHRLARAARALGVEHTTVARRIQALEAELSTPLFHRTAAGHQLTRVGRRTLAEAEAMEQAALAFQARAQAEHGLVEGRVRLALIESLSVVWLAPHLPALHQRHPKLELQIEAGNAQTDLSRGEAEIAIRTPRPPQSGLVATRLGWSRFGLFATAELARRLPRGALEGDRPDTHGVPLLAYTPALDFLQNAPWFRELLARSTVALLTSSTLTLQAAVQAGAGIGVLPGFVPRRHRELVRVAGRDVSVQDAWLVTHAEFRRDPRVRAVWDFLRGIAGDLLDPPVLR
jgi:DNA-binding transcriptional LysR family regulator